MIKFLITSLLLISPTLVIAQVVAKDEDTATFTTSKDVTISELKSQIAIYENEKAKCLAQWDGFIKPVQKQINDAAEAGVKNAIPLANAEAFDSVAQPVNAEVNP